MFHHVHKSTKGISDRKMIMNYVDRLITWLYVQHYVYSYVYCLSVKTLDY